jgi:hypothetical protein
VITPPVDSSNDHLANVKAFETWGELHANQQSHHVSIGMDSYAELDFVSTDFVHSLGLTPCQKRQHNHHIPHIEAAGCSSLKTHSVYHLHDSAKNKKKKRGGFTIHTIFVVINASGIKLDFIKQCKQASTVFLTRKLAL